MLSPNQESAHKSILPYAKLGMNKTQAADLPVRPRTHTLICSPSGTGKSYLMQRLGHDLDSPVLHLNVSNWQPIGSKGHNYTWDTIVEFLDKNPKGIIALDEIDKISSDADWAGYIRLEIFSLLDGKIPNNVTIPSDETEDDSDILW